MNILILTTKKSPRVSLAKPLREKGHEVNLIDYRSIKNKTGFYSLSKKSGNMNQIIEKTVDSLIKRKISRYNPDLLIADKAEFISQKTIASCDCTSILWFPDDPQKFKLSKKLSRAYDMVLTNSQEVLDNYPTKAKFFPFGVPKHLKEKEDADKKYDISFIGSFDSKRERYLETLGREEWEIFAGGPNFKEIKGVETEKKYFKREEMFEIYNRSKIVLNTVKTREHISQRAFEGSGVHTALVSEYMTGYQKFYDKDEIAIFNSKSEMKEKIKTLLNRKKEREKLARKGRERTLQNYTYEKLSQDIIEYSEKLT